MPNRDSGKHLCTKSNLFYRSVVFVAALVTSACPNFPHAKIEKNAPIFDKIAKNIEKQRSILNENGKFSEKLRKNERFSLGRVGALSTENMSMAPVLKNIRRATGFGRNAHKFNIMHLF